MLTQPAIKSSLAWSTIAQMGFMLLQCGLALFPLALLHIVAHSLYKAHSFLGAGRDIGRVAAIRRPGPVAVPGIGAVGRAFALAVAIYVAVGLLFGIADKAPQVTAMGAILVMGTAYLLAQGLADTAPSALTWRMAGYSAAAGVAYFTLQAIATRLMVGTLPPPPQAGGLEWALILLSVLSFGLLALMQALLPLWSHHPAAAALRVHLANGLYVNAIADRLLGSWSLRKPN
jgi:NAD(P)H-quinone oxidoreductase subunit 5